MAARYHRRPAGRTCAPFDHWSAVLSSLGATPSIKRFPDCKRLSACVCPRSGIAIIGADGHQHSLQVANVRLADLRQRGDIPDRMGGHQPPTCGGACSGSVPWLRTTSHAPCSSWPVIAPPPSDPLPGWSAPFHPEREETGVRNRKGPCHDGTAVRPCASREAACGSCVCGAAPG
jgi:hypothetical protein